MAPKKGKKNANAKKGGKKPTVDHDSETEDNHMPNESNDDVSDAEYDRRGTKKLERQLTYSEADAEVVAENSAREEDIVEESEDDEVDEPTELLPDMPNLADKDNEVQPENEEDSSDSASELPAKTGPSKNGKGAKSAPKQLKEPGTKAADQKATKAADEKAKNGVESIFDPPENPRKRGNAKQNDEPPTKTAPPKKGKAAKPVLKQKKGNKVQSNDEEEVDEEDEEPVAEKETGGKAVRKQLGKTNKNGKENDPPARATKSGKTAQTSKSVPDKSSEKAATKSKKKAQNDDEVDNEDNDALVAHEKSLHINVAPNATIDSKIREVIIGMTEQLDRCTLKDVIANLQKDNHVDVDRHNEKIRKVVKQMLTDKEIVPLRRLKTKPSVSVVFKLSSKLKKKPVSAQKRKSILMAEKKKQQNDKKAATKQAASKKKAKKATAESDLEQYNDDEDVPPVRR